MKRLFLAFTLLMELTGTSQAYSLTPAKNLENILSELAEYKTKAKGQPWVSVVPYQFSLSSANFLAFSDQTTEVEQLAAFNLSRLGVRCYFESAQLLKCLVSILKSRKSRYSEANRAINAIELALNNASIGVVRDPLTLVGSTFYRSRNGQDPLEVSYNDPENPAHSISFNSNLEGHDPGPQTDDERKKAKEKMKERKAEKERIRIELEKRLEEANQKNKESPSTLFEWIVAFLIFCD